MREILDYIDSRIHDCLSEVERYGLCHLIEDDSEEKYPSTLEEDAKKITPNDRFEFQYYHRLLNGSNEPLEDLSFGRTPSVLNSQEVRTVIFARMKCDDLRFIDDFINSLPDNIVLNESPQKYKKITLSKNISLIRDSTAIWEDEFSTAYKDKYQKAWNIYALEYSIEYIKCPVCVT